MRSGLLIRSVSSLNLLHRTACARKAGWQPPQACSCTASPSKLRKQSSMRRLHACDAVSDKQPPDWALEGVPDNLEEDFDEDFDGDFEEDLEGLSDLDELDDADANGHGIDTGKVDWGVLGLDAAKRVLESPAFGHLQLFSYTAVGASKRVDVRLDKPEDKFGSPTLDDISDFSRSYITEFDQALGSQAGTISVQVSSPGAERPVRVPDDLLRFKDLPMKVDYRSEDKSLHGVLQLVQLDSDAQTTEWRLADVRANRSGAGKGRTKLTKKAAEQRFTIPVADLQGVRLHMDF
ncbi:hypothetical protein WJX72_006504 [[Myrmecia] bisecta]|uniref:DUF7912 domain-containing protein n=1 Tax=[Myrmecia] bisecta TaxID=41462 RepID=A0AAW1QS92_9CHLO